MNAIAVKIVTGLAGLGLLWVAVSIVLGWRHKATVELPAAQRDLAAISTAFNDYRRNTANEITRLAAIASSYEAERNALRLAAASRPAPVVRLCPAAESTAPTAGRSDPAAPGAADGTTPGAGGVSGVPGRDTGRDIGGPLASLLDQADEVSAQVRGLQLYIRGLPQACLPDWLTDAAPN